MPCAGDGDYRSQNALRRGNYASRDALRWRRKRAVRDGGGGISCLIQCLNERCSLRACLHYPPDAAGNDQSNGDQFMASSIGCNKSTAEHSPVHSVW
ncbi:unnamed protein product [Eretmochelys imbricata]